MVFAILGRNSDAFAKVLQLELAMSEPRASTEDEVIPEEVQKVVGCGQQVNFFGVGFRLSVYGSL